MVVVVVIGNIVIIFPFYRTDMAHICDALNITNIKSITYGPY
jgi:hypothetical protein